ncbi:MAG UNVERIFIED_CONTAM: hypothetical protein LVR18_40445 [Planctomycetaceae bacterium]
MPKALDTGCIAGSSLDLIMPRHAWKFTNDPPRRRSSGRSFTAESLESRLYAGSLTGLPFLLPASSLDSLPDPSSAGISEDAIDDRSRPATVPLRVRYDFRDHEDVRNEITPKQQQLAEVVLQSWQQVLGPGVSFQRDFETPLDSILNIGVGSLAIAQLRSGPGGVLGLGGGQLIPDGGGHAIRGLVWLDSRRRLDSGRRGRWLFQTRLQHGRSRTKSGTCSGYRIVRPD